MRCLVVVMVAFVTGTSCQGPCRALAEKQCECAPNSIERNNCVQRLASTESASLVSADDAVACQALLDAKQCDCRLVDTAAGKERCGQARPRPDAGAL
jgi:hypothetical protein